MNVDVEIGEAYRLEVTDNFLDGICCQYGNGTFNGYAVYDDGTEIMLFENDGRFTSSAVHEFIIPPPPPPQQSSSPTASPIIQTVPTPGYPPCSICANTPGGEGRITLPDVVINDGVSQPTTCHFLERAAQMGFFPADTCATITDHAADCGCTPLTSPAPVTLAPTTAAPVTPAPAPQRPPSPGHPPCNICGTEGRVISSPDVVVNIPDQDPVTCGVLFEAGMTGYIEERYCPITAGLSAPCGCTTAAPVSVPPPPLPVPPPPPGGDSGDGVSCLDTDTLFPIDSVQGDQGCAFLQENPSYQYLCDFLDVAVACKATCNVCFMFE